jgi:hypothetical protein
MGYYLDNMAKWPECFSVQESADGQIMGYGSARLLALATYVQPSQ